MRYQMCMVRLPFLVCSSRNSHCDDGLFKLLLEAWIEGLQIRQQSFSDGDDGDHCQRVAQQACIGVLSELKLITMFKTVSTLERGLWVERAKTPFFRGLPRRPTKLDDIHGIQPIF